MDKTESQLTFYREQIATWRWKDWSWERIRMEDRGPDALERKLEGWAEDGHVKLTPEEWLELVREAEQKERWNAGERAVDTDNPEEMERYFQACLRKAPTKVGRLLAKAQAGDFVRARELASGRAPLPSGYGNKTVLDLVAWLKRWDPNPQEDAGETAGDESLPAVPGLTEEEFGKKVEEAPESIRHILEGLKNSVVHLQGAADFCRLDIDKVAKAVHLKAVGKKSWEHLKKWQRELVSPTRFPCADYEGWAEWLGAVFQDLLEFAGLSDAEASLGMFVRRMGLDSESDGPLPTLDEVGKEFGNTRERTRQVEELFLTGGKSKNFRGIAMNRGKFGDFLRIMGEVFGDDGVLSMEEFGKRLAERSPWPGEDFRHRAARLLAILEEREPDKVPGVVTFRQGERVEERYEAFKEAVAGGVVRCLDATYETILGLMEARGVQGFSKSEFEYCCVRVGQEQDTPSTVRLKLKSPTKRDFVRQAVFEIFEPENGYRELTLVEMEQRLKEKLGDKAPNLRGFLNRKPPVDLDGQGTIVCLVDQGGGVGRVSRYALSKFLPKLAPDTIWKMEEELLAHLKEYRIVAALVTPYYKCWKEKGWVPEGMAPRLLFDELCRGSTRTIVDYPEGNSSWAYSLPGAVLPGTGILKSQAMLYFRGKATVSKRDLQEFAEDGFGLSGAMIKIECARQFSKTKEGLYIINENLLDS